MIDYEMLLTELQEEKETCQYAYGSMVPAFYASALQKAIEAIKECQDCASEAERTAREVRRFDAARRD